MSSDLAPSWPLVPVRPSCAQFDLGALERHRCRDLVDFAGPLAFGLAAWASACRLTWVMRWLKAGEDEATELDPVG